MYMYTYTYIYIYIYLYIYVYIYIYIYTGKLVSPHVACGRTPGRLLSAIIKFNIIIITSIISSIISSSIIISLSIISLIISSSITIMSSMIIICSFCIRSMIRYSYDYAKVTGCTRSASPRHLRGRRHLRESISMRQS